jgi:hypothetical protein
VNWFQRLLSGGPVGGALQPAGVSESPGPQVASESIVRRSARDLVDGLNALAEYHRYKEAGAYDRGLKTMREHRDFRDEFLKRTEAILNYADNVQARGEIQDAMQKEVAAFAGVQAPASDAATDARSRNPSGYALLGLAAPLTFESLKAAYRKAALAHHPDVGGDNRTMQQVNDAYELFTAVLRGQAAETLLQPQPQIADVKSFFASIRYTKFYMLVDDFDASAAFETYKTLNICDLESQFRSWDIVARLCELLAAGDRLDEAKRVLHDLGTIVDDGEKRDLNLQPIYRKTSEACVDPKGIRFIPNHMRQADNLLRLGLIDKKRHDAIAKRIGGAVEKIAEDEGVFEAFARSYRFLQLPMDPPVATRRPGGLVPGPDYYARVEALTAPQQAEYAQAFHAGAVEFMMKYMAVRIDALFRSPFLGYVDRPAILIELRALDSAPGMKPGLRSLCGEAIKVVAFLDALPEKDRSKRIAMLTSLDSDGGPATLTISLSGIGVTMPRPIVMNPSYTQFATAPLEQIERYIRTGSELTPEEQLKRQERWEASKAFHDSDVYKHARDATWRDKTPEAIVPAVTALCETLYQRATVPHEEPLEIGYWTDKLTTALVKMKRFADALRWIQRYEDTALAIKGRDSGGVLESLAKRKARCEAAIRS